jgi:5'-nucleotidase
LRPCLSTTAAAVAAALAATTAAVALPLSNAAAQTAAAGTEIQILGINDFHGHLDPGTGTAPSVAGVLGGAVKQLRAENPNTIFVSAGDNIGASPFISSSQRDEPTLDVLDAMGLAVSALGNHELDRGYADLANRVEPRADFPILGANVEGESPALEEYEVVPTASGITVGFVGVVTQETGTLVSPAGIPGITFSDPVAAANRVADALSDGNAVNGEADVVVLLAHEGAATAAPAGSTNAASCSTIGSRDDAFGRIIRNTTANVDAILGGHTHLNVDCEYPLPSGQLRPVLEASEYGTRLDRLRLTYDTATRRVTAASGDVLSLAAVNGVFPYTADPAVEQIVDAAEARANELGKEVIGSITTDIPRAKTASGAEDRGSESLLGNFIADVQLGATSGSAQEGGPAQIAFMNPGGLRADLLLDASSSGEARGAVTYAEAAVVQPFANTLFTLTLTGAQLKSVLEEQYQPAGSSRPFLALGVSKGFRYELEGLNPAGSRIQNITLNGTPIDLNGTYRIVTNSFLASGGDNFRTLASGTNRRDTGLDDLSILVAHFRASSPITPDTTDRSVVKSVPAPSPSATPTATITPSATATATTTPSPAPCGPATVTLERTAITATSSAGVSVRATANSVLDLYAYTQPSRTFRVVRSAEVGADGVAAFRIAPPANTRLYAQQRGCPAPDVAATSVVLNVRTALSLTATRTGVRSYTFRGDSLPARAGGLIVSLYRVQPDGRQVLTAQTRASATTGEWRIDRRFTGSGRFGFVVRTGQDAQNAPGASNVRSTLVY